MAALLRVTAGVALAVGAAVVGRQAPLPTCTETAGPTRALGLFKPGQPVSLEEGFRDPPPISRAQCWWQSFGSAFTKPEITRALEEFKAKGMGGVTIKDTLLMPRDEKTAHIKDIPYMSPEWLEMFAHVAAECRRLGLILRVRLGSGWNEGGPWVTGEMSSQALAFVMSQPIPGNSRYVGRIPEDGGAPTVQALRKGEAFVVAVPAPGRKGVDVTRHVSPEGTLTWDAPAGEWTLVSCFSRPSGIRNMSVSPSGDSLHHDHMRTDAADVHLDHVGGRISRRLGPFSNTAFDGFNTDSWELGTPTWTPGFRAVFVERRGYDPAPYLPVLMSVKETGTHGSRASRVSPDLTEVERRFLFDLRTTVSDLIVERFYRHVARWSRARGVAYEAQAGGPVHVPKDLLQAQGAVDIPMGEFWITPWTLLKVPSSAAHAYGKRLVGMESLTHTSTGAQHHFSTTPATMTRHIDQAFLLGGNYITMAVTEYSPAEAGLPGWVHNCGPHVNHTQTWWPMARPFFDYLGRCSFLLQSGRNVAHAAVYHTFRTDEDGRWDEANNDLSKWPNGLAFDYVGDDLVQSHMRVRDGRIVLDSGASYPVLAILPTPRPTMPLATLTRIRELIRQGATVVWFSRPAPRCPGLTDHPKCDSAFAALLDELDRGGHMTVLGVDGWAGLLETVQRSPDPPTWRIALDSPLRFVHRRTSGADIFFVGNRSDRFAETPVTFRIRDRNPEWWNPDTGNREPALSGKAAEGVRVAIRLPAWGSAFIVFRTGADAPAPRAAVHSRAPFTIAGPWEVGFAPGRGAPARAVFQSLGSWTESDDPGIRHFSGIATYKASFRFDGEARGGPAVLDLGTVAEVCEVRMNGRLVGNGWRPPYRFDVTGHLAAGVNSLEIRVANLWQNRLVGDAELAATDRITRAVPDVLYTQMRGRKLLASGLIGPVQVVFGERIAPQEHSK